MQILANIELLDTYFGLRRFELPVHVFIEPKCNSILQIRFANNLNLGEDVFLISKIVLDV